MKRRSLVLLAVALAALSAPILAQKGPGGGGSGPQGAGGATPMMEQEQYQ